MKIESLPSSLSTVVPSGVAVGPGVDDDSGVTDPPPPPFLHALKSANERTQTKRNSLLGRMTSPPDPAVAAIIAERRSLTRSGRCATMARTRLDVHSVEEIAWQKHFPKPK
jgi:hypothetical protein